MIRKIIVIAILMLVYAAALSACNETQPSAPELQNINLKLNWKHGTSFIGFYIAQSQGFFADEGLDVSIEELSDPSLASEIPAQILNGEFEFGIAASDLARAQIKGLELTAFGNIIKLSPAAFFVRKDSGIHTPADFAGRTVVIKSQSWQEILEGFLENAGLVIDDVEVVPGGYDLTPFYEGDVEI